MRAVACAVLLLALSSAAAVRAQDSDWMSKWAASGGSMNDLMDMVKKGDSAPGSAVGGGSPSMSMPPMTAMPPPSSMGGHHGHSGSVGGGSMGGSGWVMGGEPWHHFRGNGNSGVTLRPARILLGSSNEMIFFPGTCTPNPCQNGGTCHLRYSGLPALTTVSQQVYCSCPAQYSGPRCEYDTCLHAVCKDSDSPTLVVPSDVIVECGESTDPDDDGTGAALATDVCFNVSIGVTNVESPLSAVQPNCPLAETITRTFTATSTCNFTTVGSQIIYVVKQNPPKVRATLAPTAPLAISASQLSLTPEQSMQLLMLAAGVAIDLKEASKLGMLRDMVGGSDKGKDSIFGGLVDRLALDRKGGSSSLAGKPDGFGDALRSVGLIGSAPSPSMGSTMPSKPMMMPGAGPTLVQVPDNTVNMHNNQVVGSDGILSKMDQEVIFAQWLHFGTRLPVGATVCSTPTLRAFRVMCSSTDRCTLQTLGTVFTPGTAGGMGSMYGMAASASRSNVGMGSALNATATIVVRRIVGRKSIGFQGINFDPKEAALQEDMRRMMEDKRRMMMMKDVHKFGEDSVLAGDRSRQSMSMMRDVGEGEDRMHTFATTTTTATAPAMDSGKMYGGSAPGSAPSRPVSSGGGGISDADILNSREFERQRSGATVLSSQCQTRVDTFDVPCGSVIVAKLDAEDACLQDDFIADSPWHMERMFTRTDFEDDPFAGDVDAWKGRTSFGAHLFRGTTVSLRVGVSDVCGNVGYGFDDPSRNCETFVAGVCCPPITNALSQFELSQIRGDPRPQAQEVLSAAASKLSGDKGIGSIASNPGIRQAGDELRALFGGSGKDGGAGGNVGVGGGFAHPMPMMPMRP